MRALVGLYDVWNIAHRRRVRAASRDGLTAEAREVMKVANKMRASAIGARVAKERP